MSSTSITRRKLALGLGTALLSASLVESSAHGKPAVSGHVVLLGDSIFDNGSYTAGQPDVLGHLRSLLPHRWKASLRAVDGARVSGLRQQLVRLPADATHLVVAIGGNDALANMDLLSTPVASTAAALTLFDQRVSAFEVEYRAAIAHVLKLGKPLTLCTVYNGNLDAAQARNARLALAMFNDAILRTAFEHSLNVIELRLVCTEPADYANPIEPSGSGGRKIAQAILTSLGVDARGRTASQVIASGR